MGLIFRRRIGLGRRLWANLSGAGVSVSGRRGPVTANSRGGFSVRLFRGLSWRGRWR
jgi:hypothetical protein